VPDSAKISQRQARITGEDTYTVPMRIYPAPHYTMGGLWVDYHLMSTIPGLFVAGEGNFSDQGANRLGASALMQGLSENRNLIRAAFRRRHEPLRVMGVPQHAAHEEV